MNVGVLSWSSTVNYRKLWEEANNSCLLPWIDIHHINGNRNDNRLENLQPVTLQEHFDIHYAQGDYGACQAILFRINEPLDRNMLSDVASKCQNKLLKAGIHNFQKMAPARRTEISKRVGKLTLELGLGIHALNKDKQAHLKIASIGGQTSRDTKSGFHNPEKNGYNFVRNTVWWTNINTKQRKRSKTQPGPEWARGMK
jgi:hypothetical protein